MCGDPRRAGHGQRIQHPGRAVCEAQTAEVELGHVAREEPVPPMRGSAGQNALGRRLDEGVVVEEGRDGGCGFACRRRVFVDPQVGFQAAGELVRQIEQPHGFRDKGLHLVAVQHDQRREWHEEPEPQARQRNRPNGRRR